jgi:hypothetical protein
VCWARWSTRHRMAYWTCLTRRSRPSSSEPGTDMRCGSRTSLPRRCCMPSYPRPNASACTHGRPTRCGPPTPRVPPMPWRTICGRRPDRRCQRGAAGHTGGGDEGTQPARVRARRLPIPYGARAAPAAARRRCPAGGAAAGLGAVRVQIGSRRGRVAVVPCGGRSGAGNG